LLGDSAVTSYVEGERPAGCVPAGSLPGACGQGFQNASIVFGSEVLRPRLFVGIINEFLQRSVTGASQ
jgi:hypothetical protein